MLAKRLINYLRNILSIRNRLHSTEYKVLMCCYYHTTAFLINVDSLVTDGGEFNNTFWKESCTILTGHSAHGTMLSTVHDVKEMGP